MLDKTSGQPGTHTYAERGLDYYATPDVAVQALLACEKLPLRIWEPAAGEGAIVNPLRAAGHIVFASDIIDRGCGVGGVDFLTTEDIPPVDAIVTNPPFRYAEEFVERALELVPMVVMLLRLAFYESERRRHLLEHCGLVRIHCFRKRLPMMHREGWAGPKASSGMAFAWYVWQRGMPSSTVIDRI